MIKPTMTRAELEAEVAKNSWFHSIDLGHGVVTPGKKTLQFLANDFSRTFDELDLQGASVLDIGAWDGAFSVEAKRRGAKRVAALDHTTWNNARNGRQSFDLVNRALGLEVEAIDLDLDAPKLSLAHLGKFDFVLFLGVFYHLKDPIAALREVAALAGKALVVESHIQETTDPRPSMMFYPGTELGGDKSNWWGPNTACMVALLKMVGFARVETTAGASHLRGVFHAFRD